MEEEGLSLLDLWKMIVKKRRLAYIVFGVTTLFILLFILLVYNPLRESYEVSFSYQWEGIENNKYANGVIFNEYDIISLKNLNEVKESHIDFEHINTTQLQEKMRLEKKEEEGIYILKVPGAPFKSDSIARRFIEQLVNLPYLKALNLDFDFTAHLSGYTRSVKISNKLTYLQNQLNLILTGYQSMISHFGDIQIGDAHLSSLMRKAEVFQANNDLKIFEYQAYKNAYMTKEEYQAIVKEKEVLLTEQELLRNRKSILLESLKNIYSNSNGNTYLDTSIANYLNHLHTLDTRLMKINEDLKLYDSASLGIYNEEASAAFVKDLDAYKAKLEEVTGEYTSTVKEVLKENTILHIEPIKVLSRIHPIFAGFLSVFIGIFTAMALALAWAYIQENKIKEKALE